MIVDFGSLRFVTSMSLKDYSSFAYSETEVDFTRSHLLALLEFEYYPLIRLISFIYLPFYLVYILILYIDQPFI